MSADADKGPDTTLHVIRRVKSHTLREVNNKFVMDLTNIQVIIPTVGTI